MNLERLEKQLDNTGARYAAGDSDVFIGWLRQLCSNGKLQTMLTALAADPSRLAAVARRSYKHSNGFLKIVLFANPGCKLRLHLWDPKVPANREDIHNHRWDFASHMLTGGYRYQEFISAAGGSSYFGYTYHSAEGADAFDIKEQGEQTLRCVYDARIEAGTTYLLCAEVLHRVISRPDRATATLILQGSARRHSTDLYTIADAGPSRAIPITWLETTEVRRHLNELAVNLGKRL